MPTATRAAETSAALVAGSGQVARSWERLAARAARPVASDSVAAFRIGFGLLVAFGSIRFLTKGWVETLYLSPQHHLSYRGFDWVQPMPAPLMYAHMVALALLGLAIAAGYRHRLATGAFVVGFTYTELIEASLYLNHYWFVTLAGILLLVLPAHHHWSVDTALGRVVRSRVVSAWVVWALRAQLAVVYVFAGVAKLNGDWLFRAEPMTTWFGDRTATPVVGWLLALPSAAVVASWSGALFDCTIVWFLLWRKTRKWAYATLVVFHSVTGALFQIGVFPWVMMVCALVFFEPRWPRDLAHRLGFGGGTDSNQRQGADRVEAPSVSRSARAFLCVFAAAQLVLPLRHYAHEGNVRWTEEGYYLSWRVMLTEKAGFVTYQVTDPISGSRWEASPALVLEDWQHNHAATRPDLLHATALLLADHYAQHGIANVEVRAEAWVTMNGLPAQLLVDPTVDLAAYERGGMPAGWILPAPAA